MTKRPAAVARMDLEEGVARVERRMAEERDFDERRRETGLSTVGQLWLDLDDAYSDTDEYGYMGHRYTLHAFLFLYLEHRSVPRLDGKELPPPPIPNDDARAALHGLLDEDPIDAAYGFCELLDVVDPADVGLDVPDRDETEPETPHQ